MNASIQIEARAVPQEVRATILPQHFGRHMLTVEGRIYDFMTQFAKTYRGGHWEFFELSNGGFYMRPPEDTYQLRIYSNGFSGPMSADAAGITVCLFAFSHLSFECAGSMFAEHFHWLREFSLNHPEAGVIFAAID